MTEADFAKYHVVLFGDPGSNKWIAKLNGKLPVKWTKETRHAWRADFPGQRKLSGPDLPEPAQPDEVRGAEYRTDHRGSRLQRRLRHAALGRLRDRQGRSQVRKFQTCSPPACSTRIGTCRSRLGNHRSTRMIQEPRAHRGDNFEITTPGQAAARCHSHGRGARRPRPLRCRPPAREGSPSVRGAGGRSPRRSGSCGKRALPSSSHARL